MCLSFFVRFTDRSWTSWTRSLKNWGEARQLLLRLADRSLGIYATIHSEFGRQGDRSVRVAGGALLFLVAKSLVELIIGMNSGGQYGNAAYRGTGGCSAYPGNSTPDIASKL